MANYVFLLWEARNPWTSSTIITMVTHLGQVLIAKYYSVLKTPIGQTWWYKPAILPPGMMRQEDCKLQANLGFKVRLKTKK
jgi:hypothetical protein